jgi:hypothetical protein
MTDALAGVLGVDQHLDTRLQTGRFDVRAGVNSIEYMDRIRLDSSRKDGDGCVIGVIGAGTTLRPAAERQVVGRFDNGEPAIISGDYGAGRVLYVGACPGIAYIKEAHFVRDALAEKWPEDLRRFINRTADLRGVSRLVDLSHPVVEAGLYDSPKATCLVLANFTYETIDELKVRLRLPQSCRTVQSIESGKLPFSCRKLADGRSYPFIVEVSQPLRRNDMVLFGYR